MSGETPIMILGIVGAKNLDPGVDIQFGDIHFQCTALKAKEIALLLLEASEAAMSDAFIVRFFMEKTGCPFDGAMGAIFKDFREFREEQRKKETA